MPGRRILLRTSRDPLQPIDARSALERDVFWGNSGNLLFAAAAWAFYSVPGADVVATGITGADPDDAARVNDEFDAFVLPLANAFRPSFVEPLGQLTEFIRRLRIPVVVLGVGVQCGLDDDLSTLADVADPARAFMAAALDRSPVIGVRGELTADWLRGLGFDDVEVIGCPSMYLRGPEIAVSSVGDQLATDARVTIATNPHLGAMRPVVRTALRSSERLSYVAQHTSELRLFLDGPYDGRRRRPSSKPIELGHPLLRPRRARFYLDPWPWIRFLSTQQFVFGARIHGNIAGILGGTPALVLAHDGRTLELARTLGIPYARLDSFAGEAPTPADLFRLARYDTFAVEHRRRFDRFVAFLDRHPVNHVFSSGDGTAAFLAAMAATPYPGPVRPPRPPIRA